MGNIKGLAPYNRNEGSMDTSRNTLLSTNLSESIDSLQGFINSKKAGDVGVLRSVVKDLQDELKAMEKANKNNP